MLISFVPGLGRYLVLGSCGDQSCAFPMLRRRAPSLRACICLDAVQRLLTGWGVQEEMRSWQNDKSTRKFDPMAVPGFQTKRAMQ